MIVDVMNLNMDCTAMGSQACTKAIYAKIKALYPNFKFMSETPGDKVNGHVSISHFSGKHHIWICVYEEDGKHESCHYNYEPVKENKNYDRVHTMPNQAKFAENQKSKEILVPITHEIKLNPDRKSQKEIDAMPDTLEMGGTMKLVIQDNPLVKRPTTMPTKAKLRGLTFASN